MNILMAKADWGLEHIGNLEARINKIAKDGFDCIECFFVTIQPNQFKECCQKANLKFCGGLVARSVETFKKRLPRILLADPIIINCHGGVDYFSFKESVHFFRECMKIANGETDVEVVFETHRGTSLYAPWVAERLLNELPDLRLCADFSHYTCVSETDMESSINPETSECGEVSLISDSRKKKMMDVLISKTNHIHARVGDTQSPQVADPRINEGLVWTEYFEKWWDKIIAKGRDEGRSFMVINPEYGPNPYAPCYPETGEQISDHWDLAIWGMERLRKRYMQG